jgi:hypothetical protein
MPGRSSPLSATVNASPRSVRRLPSASLGIDNAVAETVNGYYKSELIYGPARTGPWKTVEDVQLASRLGALAQHRSTTRLPQRHPTRRVRSHVLRSPTEGPTPV